MCLPCRGAVAAGPGLNLVHLSRRSRISADGFVARGKPSGSFMLSQPLRHANLAGIKQALRNISTRTTTEAKITSREDRSPATSVMEPKGLSAPLKDKRRTKRSPRPELAAPRQLTPNSASSIQVHPRETPARPYQRTPASSHGVVIRPCDVTCPPFHPLSRVRSPPATASPPRGWSSASGPDRIHDRGRIAEDSVGTCDAPSASPRRNVLRPWVTS